MNILKKFVKAVLVTYGFILAMMLGLIIMINILIWTVH